MKLRFRCVLLVATLGFLPATLVASDDLLFSASDFPKLAGGVPIEKAGEYTVKIWSPSGISWSMKTRAPRSPSRPTVESQDDAPRWTTLEKVAISAGKPLVVNVEKASFEPEEIIGNYSTGKQRTKASPATIPVPAAMVSLNPTPTSRRIST